jgi:TPR repeat protein
MVEEIMKWVEANDAIAMGMLGSYYNHGQIGLQLDHNKAIELWTQSADLGCSKAHINLSDEYRDLGDMKKANWRLLLWQGMKGQEAILDTLNFYSSIIWTELLSIGSLRHLLGITKPCNAC